MLTPGYPITASSQVLPSVNIDFTTASLDARIALTRSLNTATRVNSSGLIEVVNADLPRFDYDPTTLACRGLLIEPAVTNLFLNTALAGGVSGSPGTAPTSWTQTTVSTPTITYATDPDFSAGNCIRIQASAARQFYGQTVAVSANTIYAFSIEVNIATSAALTQLIGYGSPPAGATATNYVDGVLFPNANLAPPTGKHTLTSVLTVAGTGGSPAFRFGLGVSGSSSGDITFARPQLEVGYARSSYIPTTTGTVTRNADVAVMTGANFSSWWAATSGAMVVQARQRAVSLVCPWMQMDDTTASNFIVLRGNTTNPELYIKATTDQAVIDAGTIASITDYRLGGAWTTDNCAAAIAGGAAVTDLSATIPTVTQARLGSDGTNYLNGWLQNLRYWPQRVTNAEIQAFSK